VTRVFHLDANRAAVDVYNMGWKAYVEQRETDERRRHRERKNAERELQRAKEAAEAAKVPVMIHSGTSTFPAAKSRFGDPIHVDDIAVDHPELTILLAHGGRPLWCETAFFLARRHRNLYIDISSIPPNRLLRYFPRLEEIQDKVLFGSDWPGPGVPSIQENLDGIEELMLSKELREKVFVTNARKVFP